MVHSLHVINTMTNMLEVRLFQVHLSLHLHDMCITACAWQASLSLQEMHAVSLHGLGDLLLQIEALEKQRLRVVMSMYACMMIVMVMVMVMTMIDNE